VNVDLGTTGNRVLNNQIHHNGATDLDHGLYLKGAGLEISGNDVHDNIGYGAQLYEGSGSKFSGVTVANNHFTANGKSGLLISQGSDSVTVSGNIFSGNKQAGLQTNYTPVTNVTVSGNTASGDGTWEYDFQTGAGITSTRNSATGPGVLRVTTAVTGFRSDFNTFAPAVTSYSYNGTTYQSLVQYQAASGQDANSKVAAGPSPSPQPSPSPSPSPVPSPSPSPSPVPSPSPSPDPAAPFNLHCVWTGTRWSCS